VVLKISLKSLFRLTVTQSLCLSVPQSLSSLPRSLAQVSQSLSLSVPQSLSPSVSQSLSLSVRSLAPSSLRHSVSQSPSSLLHDCSISNIIAVSGWSCYPRFRKLHRGLFTVKPLCGIKNLPELPPSLSLPVSQSLSLSVRSLVPSLKSLNPSALSLKFSGAEQRSVGHGGFGYLPRFYRTAVACQQIQNTEYRTLNKKAFPKVCSFVILSS
jgi:hypothetical protein